MIIDDLLLARLDEIDARQRRIEGAIEALRLYFNGLSQTVGANEATRNDLHQDMVARMFAFTSVLCFAGLLDRDDVDFLDREKIRILASMDQELATARDAAAPRDLTDR